MPAPSVSQLVSIAQKSGSNYSTYITNIKNQITGVDLNDAATAANVNSAWNQVSSSSSSTTSSTTTGGDTGSGGPFNTVMKIANNLAVSQQQKGYASFEDETIRLDQVMRKFIDDKGRILELDKIGQNLVEMAGDQAIIYLKQQTQLLTLINKEAGLTGKFSKAFRDELTQASPELLRIGISFEDLARASKQVVDQSGRFLALNRETWKDAGYAASAYVGTLRDLVAMYPEFEKIGLGAEDTNKAINSVGQKSIGLGLQAQKTTSELSKNIGRLNDYGFKNGVEGLASMVRKATEFRMSMDEVFKVAEKVMDPDKAIELTANLQVLGGAIGDFNDPLKLMYMATNNVEGLQDALIGAAGSLATYNSEQGRFEITGVNLRRAKAEADALGISYQEFSKGAIAAAERASASAALMSRGLNLKDEEKEFLTNIAQMKGGKMMIEIQGDQLREDLKLDKGTKEIALENLTDSQAKTLLAYQEDLKNKTPEEIVRGQATSITNIERDVNFMVALMRVRGGQAAEKIYKEVLQNKGFSLEKMSKDFHDTTTNVGPKIDNAITNFTNKAVDFLKGDEDKTKSGKKTSTSTTTSTNPVTPAITTTPAPTLVTPSSVATGTNVATNNLTPTAGSSATTTAAAPATSQQYPTGSPSNNTGTNNLNIVMQHKVSIPGNFLANLGITLDTPRSYTVLTH
jgi:hypothetical protein